LQSSPNAAVGPDALPIALPPTVTAHGKITHVVVIMQENRSFDDMFSGFPGADTVTFGYGHGVKYPLAPVSLASIYDINHSHTQFIEDYDGGRADGFDREVRGYDTWLPRCSDNAQNIPSCWRTLGPPAQRLAYGYVPRSESAPYWTLAREYALGDRTFQSNNGPSYPSHQYMIAGQSEHVDENPDSTPWGCDGPSSNYTDVLKYGKLVPPPVFTAHTGVDEVGPPPCFSYHTAATLLDAKHVAWAYYAPAIGQNGSIWSAFDAIWPVHYSADWQRVESPETRIFSDIDNGRLQPVSWVIPSYANSDHAGNQSATGPQWVATVVNAIGKSKYWDSTAIVILWDDWGGWYDHVIPPQYPNPQTGAYEGLGFRVPLIVVSPYAKRGYVSHVQHEIASSLHLIEKTFGLGNLGQADVRADALDDMFDFSQTPTRFKPIPTTMSERDFERQPPSQEPPDE
jgi:phospholipase C